MNFVRFSLITACFAVAHSSGLGKTISHTSDIDAIIQQASPSAERLSAIPSAFWPQFIEPTEAITKDGATISTGARGVLLRCEGEKLIVDFGRWGIHAIHPHKTNFFEQVLALMKGEQTKDFPNLTLQIGNKLMHFGEDNQPKRIHMDEVKDTGYYLLLYLGDYETDTAEHLYRLGLHYERLKELVPGLTAVVMPLERKFYDFGYTVSLPVPFIFPHMRQGYIKSLHHVSDQFPVLVLADAEGAIYYQSTPGFDVSELSQEVQTALITVGIDASSALRSKERSRSRSAPWLSN